MHRSLCLLSNAYPDFPDSNRVVFIRTLAQLLSRHGWKVSVIAPRIYSGSKRREQEGEIEVNRFSSFLGNKLLLEYDRTPIFRLAGYLTAGIMSAIDCVRTRKCELIHAHWVIPAGLVAIIVGRVCNKPVVVTAHGSDILLMPMRNVVTEWFIRFVLKRADAVISVAEHLTGAIIGMGISREKIVTFPMSVPTESFCPDGPASEGWDTETVIFSNRSLYPIYNVELLIKAAPAILEKHPKASVLIAGEGPEADSLLGLARQLNIEQDVRFLGSIPHDEMPRYLRGTSVYVSTALSDGASVSLLESMACGAFPVVADIPANREWIEDGKNGFLFPPEDADALTAKVIEGLEKPELREKARAMNTEIIRQRAQWKSNVEKLFELYDRITSRK